MNQPPTLQTTRLILRPFEPSDAGDLVPLAGDRAIADTTLNIPYPYEKGMAERWIASHQEKFEAGESAVFAVVLRESNQLIGAIGLEIFLRFLRAELGYWIGKPYWGRGFCTEAGRAVLEYGFTSLSLHRVHSSHFRRNLASGRVLQKLGMKHEGCAREHVEKWGVFEDLELYGMLRAEGVP